MTRSDQLDQMMSKRALVRFSRRFEDSSIRGYVQAIGPKFFLLALVSDRIWFDGFECFRINDVRGLKLDPQTKFATAALRKRGERTPKKPAIDLADTASLLSSAARSFPLVTIHREQIDPDHCQIGRVTSVDRRSVAMLKVSPSAAWERSPTDYRLSEITRVNFGGDYEDALHIVAGDPH